MSLLEFPEAIASAIARMGLFFDKIYWFFVTIGWALTFVFYIVAFFAIQIFCIYMYYRIIMIAIGLSPKINQLLKRVDEMFE